MKSTARLSPFLTRRAFARQTAATAAAVLAVPLLTVPARAASKPVRHRFLCCDYEGNKVAIVAADGTVEWEYSAQTPQDCWMLRNGNVLICYRNGAKEVAPDKRVVWEYKAPAQALCHSCQPLRNGLVLVAECG